MLNNYLTVINAIDTFCANHANIHRFKSSFFEQMDDFSTSGNSFPIFYAVPNDIAMEENIDVMSFRIYCLDILQKDRVNEEAILNSTYQNLRDLVNWFRNDEFNDLNVLNSPRAIPVNNFLVDFTTGWYIDTELEVSVGTNDCDIPFTQNFQLTGTSCDVSYITPYLTCATVTGCTTLQEYVAQQINASSGATANYYTTGATLVGSTAFFNRNDLLSAYTLDLSSFSGGFSGWTASSGVDSIIMVNSVLPNTGTHQASLTVGMNNNNLGSYSTIAGGLSNNIAFIPGAFIGGGQQNSVIGDNSALVGGRYNSVNGLYGFIGAGKNNTLSGLYNSSIVGGSGNTAASSYSFIGGGLNNYSLNPYSIIGGGSSNYSYGNHSVIVGGKQNKAGSSYSFVGGGYKNLATGQNSFIGGGGYNRATSYYSAVGGGNNNLASGNYSFVAGGNLNTAQTNSSSVIGGQSNFVNGNSSSILGGLNNIVTGNYSIILGGQNITASQSDTVYVPFLNVQSASTDNALTDVFVRDSTGEVKLRSVSSIAPVFSGATNFYAKFTSGGSISSGMISDNGVSSSLSLASSGDNINVLIKSPAGFYYPSLTFVNDGATTVGQITGYAGRLYTSPLSVGGTIDMGANNIINMAPGVNLDDAVNVSQLFSNLGNYLNLSGGTVTGYTTFNAGLSATTLNVSTTANLFGNIFTSFSGSTNRIVEAGTTGALSATKDLIDSFLSAGTAATLLSTTSSWTVLGIYTGTSITSTYQGQQYYDANYYFVCVDDNDWIRIPRV